MNFNQAPYFDDYDELKQFYRVLFRPGVAVQTREVNQLQSILQNQISKFGNHIFKEGSLVIPGQVNYNDKASYVKISATNLAGNDLTYLEGRELITTNAGTGVRAQVIKAIPAEGADPITLIVVYSGGNETPSGDNGTAFTAGQTLFIVGEETLTVTVSNTSDITGPSAIAGIQQGVYYILGTFVTVPSSTVVVEKYITDKTNISIKVGIKYTEQIITDAEDTSLVDNANGSLNFAAPGAHRYKINTEFTKFLLEEDPKDFVELIRIFEGTVQKINNRAIYNILEDTLARRTFDESGNYVVDDFRFDLRESRKNNRGTWSSNQVYAVNDYVLSSSNRYFVCVNAGTSGNNEPATFASADETASVTDGGVRWRFTTRPISNRGVFTPAQGGAEDELVLSFGPGKAYVQGYEIDKITNTNIRINKSRDTASANNISIQTPIGNYVYIDRTRSFGLPSVSQGPVVSFFNRPIGNVVINKFGYGRRVGQGRATFVDYDSTGALKLGLTDIQMEPGRTFDRDAVAMAITDSTLGNTVTSYTLSGGVRFSGATSTFVPVQFSGAIRTSSVLAGVAVTVTGTGTIFNAELQVGDVIQIATSSNSCSYTVVSIASSANMTIVGDAITAPIANQQFGFVGYVRLPSMTLFGCGSTSLATKFRAEYQPGDTVTIGAAVSGFALTGTVVRITSDNRMTISSNITTAFNNVGYNTSVTVFTVGAGITAGLTSHSVVYAGDTATFSAEVYDNYAQGINTKRLSGLFTLTDYSGNAATIQAHQAIRLNGTGDGKLTTEAKVGDILDVNDTRLVLTNISSNTVGYAIRMDGPVVGSTTAAYPVIRVNNTIKDPDNNSLLFKVTDAVDSLRDNIYFVYTTGSPVSISTTSMEITLSTNSGLNQDTVATTDPSYFLVARGGASTLTNVIPIVGVSVVGNQMTLTTNDTFVPGGSYTVLYPVIRSTNDGNTLGGARSKTLVFDATDEYLTTASATRTTLTLGNSDVYRVNKVLMATGYVGSWDAATQATALDVTENYDFDDGQRDAFYDFGSLTLRSGSPSPSGSIKVFYDYFNHGTGDFFAYSSYSTTQVPYETVPEYNGQSLRDVLDFRCKVDASSRLVDLEIPRFGSSFLTDVSFYLARKEKVLLNRNSDFYTIASVSSINPETPKLAEDDNSVQLYDLGLEPYTRSAEWPSITIKKIDNQRYTMRDIGRMEKRITNLEEITSLSLLETKTNSLQIRDNLDSTLERYKTGFFVDNFADASNADLGANSNFALDLNTKTLYPAIKNDSLLLREKINTLASPTTATEFALIESARAISGYRVTGDLLTLDYTTSTVISQNLATTSISVTPFLVAAFLGRLELTPDSDIYTTTTNVNNVVKETFTNNVEQAIAAYRATGNWRPYRINVDDVRTLLSIDVTRELIPFCRANTILMVATGLKPNTKHYAFFDDFDVSENITGAIKMTYDSLENLNLRNIRPDSGTSKEFGFWARWRSLAESADVTVVTGRRRRRRRWVYSYGQVRKTFEPKDYHLYLPSTSYRDATRKALVQGAIVLQFESNAYRGSGVIAYQDGTTAYIVNARGRMSPQFIRSQPNQTYNYTNSQFYVAVSSEWKLLSNPVQTAATLCTDTPEGDLYSDAKGTIVALLDLPDQDTLRFLTGRKPVVITDDPDNDPDNWTSKAEAIYTSEGIKITVTSNFSSTKSFRAVPYDPVAQSFTLPEQYTSGCFVTDVDFYFARKPETEQAPIQLELRSCDSSGRPSATEIIPGSVVTLFPEDITVDSTGQAPTKFTFPVPVYLSPAKNYALALKSDSKNYFVWIAKLGEADVADSTKTYATQALLGSFFKSQDGTLWTEDQTADMKFKLNRAVFNTAAQGVTYVVNEPLPARALDADPFAFIHSSNLVRVRHSNHGFRDGDLVRFSSEYWKAQYAINPGTSINSVPVTEIFGASLTEDQIGINDDAGYNFVVSETTPDSYVINLSSFANLGTGAGTEGLAARVGGGTDILAHSNHLYHVATPEAKIMGFQETTLSFDANTIRGLTYDVNQGTATYALQNLNMDFNSSKFMDEPKVVLSEFNEITKVNAGSGYPYTVGGATESWTNSFVGRFVLGTNNDAVSPVVDLSTLYLSTITHTIDNPSRSSRLGTTLPALNNVNAPVTLINSIVQNSTAVSFTAGDNTINGTPGLFSAVTPGSYLRVSGTGFPANSNTSTGVLVTGVNPDGSKIFLASSVVNEAAGSSISVYQYLDFIDEIGAELGSSVSKFSTRKINLENPAGQLKMIMEANVPNEASFDVYYKIGPATEDFTRLAWVQFNGLPNINKTNNRSDYTEITVNVSDFDSAGNARDFPGFTAFQIKLVPRTTNAARVPSFRNLRVIAHA